MATVTNFLPVSAYSRMEMESLVSENLIDFTKRPVLNGDVVHVMKLPKGATVDTVYLTVHTTEAAVTIEVGDTDAAGQFLAATTLTALKANAAAPDGQVASLEAARKFYPNGGTLVLTIGGADAASAVVSVKVSGVMNAKSAAESAIEV